MTATNDTLRAAASELQAQCDTSLPRGLTAWVMLEDAAIGRRDLDDLREIARNGDWRFELAKELLFELSLRLDA